MPKISICPCVLPQTSKLVVIVTIAPLANCMMPLTWVGTSTFTILPWSGWLVMRRSGSEIAFIPVARRTGPMRLTSALM